MKIITLTNGKEVMIDDGDYEIASKYKWYYLILSNGKNEYVRTRLPNPRTVSKWFYLHQLLLGTIGTSQTIDHKDGNGLNNTRANLSIVSISDNSKNRRKKDGATSKYFGVYLHPCGKWLAKININGKQKHLGLFKEEIDAAKAYNIAAINTGNPYYKINTI